MSKSGNGRRNTPQHRKVRGGAAHQAVYPTFRMGEVGPDSAGSAAYIGRIGALAVALGVGMAIGSAPGAGIAHAEADTATTTGASGTSSSPPGGSADTSDPSGAETPVGGQGGSTSTNPVDDAPATADDDADADAAADEADVAGDESDTESADVEPTTAGVIPVVDAAEPSDLIVTPTDSEQRAADGLDETANPDEIGDVPATGVADTTPPVSLAVGGGSANSALQTDTATRHDPEQSALNPDSSVPEDSDSDDESSDDDASEGFSIQSVDSSSEDVQRPEADSEVDASTASDIVTTFAYALLSPLVHPSDPVAPTFTSLLLGMVAWVQREIKRYFSHGTPGMQSQGVTLVLDPGEVGDPIAFHAVDTAAEVPAVVSVSTGELAESVAVTAVAAAGAVSMSAAAGSDSAPTTVADGPFTMAKGASLTLTKAQLVGNDTDPDAGDVLSVNSVYAAKGTVVLNADGSVTYTPPSTFAGTAGFIYRVKDASGAKADNTARVTVNVINEAPTTVADGPFTMAKGASLTLTKAQLVGNDTDPDTGDVLSVNSVYAAKGTVVLNADGSVTYTPPSTFAGTAGFIYRVKDASGAKADNTARVTVNVINEAPTTVADGPFTMAKGASLTLTKAQLVGNDTDPDAGDVLSVNSVYAAKGTVVLNADGSVTYTPPSTFAGTAGFIYRVKDASGAKADNTATVTVNVINEAPVAGDDAFSTDEDTVLTGAVLGNDTDVDGDALTASVASGPSHGGLVLNADGSFTYTPDADFNGADDFTYQVSDGSAVSTGVVSIAVTAVNDAPVAGDDAFSTDEDTVLSGAVLGNDSDVDGDALTASVASGPSHGGLVLNADGSFTYTPDADFNGADGFTYEVSDGSAVSTGVVSIAVTAVNDAPVAGDDAFSTDEDTVLSGAVLGNDSDVDGDSLSASVVSGPSHGGLVLNADGSFTYTPDADFNGTDEFTYEVSDGSAASTGVVSIAVTAVNDAPVAGDDAFTTDEDRVLTGAVLTNDTDAEGDSLSASVVSGPAHGNLVLNTDGTFTYTPDADFNGTDGFTYTVSDGTTTSNAVVSIAVTAVNDAPVAGNDAFTTDEDTVLTGAVLTNDSDVDGDSLGASVVSGPSHGSLVLNADGTFTYTPDADFNGADGFTYQVSDGSAVSTGVVSIAVTAVNDAPVAGDDAFSTDEDTVLSGAVLGNDVDVDGDSLTASVVSGPSHGDLVLNADGSFTYTPDADYVGADGFTYTVSDGSAQAQGVVSIAVTAVNDAPVAGDDAFTTDEDTVLTGAVLTNDSDVDGGALTASVATGPSHGGLVLNADGSFTYTPDADYVGADGFTYEVSDGSAVSTGVVSIAVTAVNDAPVAGDDAFTTDEDTVLTGAVLTNDSDVDGDSLSASVVSGPAHGNLVLNTDGTFTYTPDADFNGTDGFTYTVSDGTTTSNAVVSIAVTAVNDAPVAGDDAFTTDEDTVLTGAVLTNDSDVDGDSLTASVVSGPSHGDLVLNADGSFTYTPDADYVGADGFTYQVSDGSAVSTGVVSIAVTAVNDAPVAGDDAFSTDEDTVLTGAVLTNDSDVDGGALTASVVSGPAHGDLVLNADGTFTYTPDADFNGTDVFTYAASDGTTTSNAVVTITVVAVNDAPVAVNDSFNTNEDTAVSGSLLGNDSDVEGSTLTASLVSGPTAAQGTLVFSSNGTFTFTPTANFNGPATFTYNVSDGALTSNTATVTINVTAVNDAPVAVNDSFNTNEDTAVSGSLLGNDSDVEGSTLTASLVSGPTAAQGTLVFNSNGTFTFTPTANFNGPATFTYNVSDGALTSNTATVTINVTAVNDAPVAVNDSFSTNEDTPLSGSVLTNDYDPEGSTLTGVTLVSGPTAAQGTLTLNGNGTFTFTPTANFNGPVTFTYKVTDGALTSNTATATINVNSVNDVPVAVGRTIQAESYYSFPIVTYRVSSGDLRGDVSDVETPDSGLTWTLVSGPTKTSGLGGNGTLTWNANGTFSYESNDTNLKNVQFTYRVTDPNGGQSATVTVVIKCGT